METHKFTLGNGGFVINSTLSLKRLTLAVAIGCFGGTAYASDYSKHPLAQEFIDEMVNEHEFKKSDLNQWIGQAQRKDSILKAISRPAEKTKPWKDYRKIFVTDSRVKLGIEFWNTHADDLARAEKEFGVPAEVIVAIIGVETRYGKQTGGYRVIDSLSTLAFDYPPRAPFFKKELKEFLLLSREQQKSPLDLKGSYAGAMGFGQFMPSSYRAYAKDFDGDEFIDIWKNPTDAIGSVANYFVRHGWKADQPVTERVRIKDRFNSEFLEDGLKPKRSISDIVSAGYSPLSEHSEETLARVFKLDGAHGDEYWMGLHNFYVITRYNRSTMYAMAVYQLSQEIKKRHVSGR